MDVGLSVQLPHFAVGSQVSMVNKWMNVADLIQERTERALGMQSNE
jgi:hypothetical protein